MKWTSFLSYGIILIVFAKAQYILYEVTAFNPHEREVLYYLHIKKTAIIFMNGVSNEAAIPMDVIVRRDASQMFEYKLRMFDIQFLYVMDITNAQLAYAERTEFEINITNAFYDWMSIQTWVDGYNDRNFDKDDITFDKIVIGKTFESRDIFILKISKGPQRPIVFIVGGEDGKDWLSSAIILNVMYELLDGTSNLSYLLDLYDFYLLPVLNPDGFVYSREKYRLWSKNRQIKQQKDCNGSVAIGVNIDRNWFLQKSSKMFDEECHSVYMGHKSLSEEETQTLSYVLNNVALKMLAFIDVRGFGRYITLPYAKHTKKANNHDIIMEIMKLASTRVYEKHNGTIYCDTTGSYFYNFSGNMADWVKRTLNTPLVFTMYLEDIATILPMPYQILPLSKEFYTVLYESLTISKQMYGPLFNGIDSKSFRHLQIQNLPFSLLQIILWSCLLINFSQY